MSEVIVVTSGKGGVGKTTITANLSIALSKLGKKVIAIDTDIGLRNLDVVMGLENHIIYNIVDVIEGNCRLHQAIIKDRKHSNLYLLPSAQSKDKDAINPNQMVNLVEKLKTQYDYILIDCAPSLGVMNLNALSASDKVIIPVQSQYLPAKGLEQLLRTITRVKRQLNPKLEVDGIVLTMVDSRTTLAREINALVRKTYGGHVFASEIPRSIKAAEISVENKSIYDHDRSGKAALAYENLTREVLSLGKQIKRHRTDPVR
jgi:septum formation inhibitor-activating ATPase MinD